jgi:hypothetical protein
VTAARAREVLPGADYVHTGVFGGGFVGLLMRMEHQGRPQPVVQIKFEHLFCPCEGGKPEWWDNAASPDTSQPYPFDEAVVVCKTCRLPAAERCASLDEAEHLARVHDRTRHGGRPTAFALPVLPECLAGAGCAA